MPLTLANVELPCPTREACAWVERHLPMGEAFPWADPAWPGPALDARTPGVPAAAMPREFRVNDFFWPNGASRWAYGAFLCSARQADLVRQAANSDNTVAGITGGALPGQRSSPIPLTLSTPGQLGGESLSVNVTLLNVVPLHSLRSTNGGTPTADDDFLAANPILLVVVDRRFYWQSAPCPDFGILPPGSYNPSPPADSAGDLPAGPVPPPVQWASLIKKLGDALGATINYDPVPAAYLSPDPSLNLAGMPAGPALDAVLANIGMRLVANYDGTFYAQSAATAIAARAADDASPAGRLRNLVAGGTQFGDTL